MRTKITRFSKWSVCISSILILVLTSVAESNISISRKIETLNVIPGNARSSSWKNTHDALIQDVNQDALYQNFSKANSAYLSGVRPDAPDVTSSIPVTESQAPEEVDTRESISSEPETILNESGSTESDPSTESSTSDSSESQSEESLIQTLRNDFSELFAYAYRPLPLAFNSVTSLSSAEASVTTDVVQEVESAPTVDATDIRESEDTVSSVEPVVTTDAVQEVESAPPVAESDIRESEPVSSEEVMTDHEDEEEHESEALQNASSTENETQSPDALLKEEQEIANQKITRVDEYSTALPHDAEPNPEEPADENEVDRNESIVFSDFALPPLNSGQFIQNTQLRISLGGSAQESDEGTYPWVEVEYSFGKSWVSAGTILLDEEVSNALNGGYYLFALPKTKDPSTLENLRVRISYVGEREQLTDLYVDSVWLELNTETFDREILEERLFPKYLSYLKLPQIHELISSELDFGRTENPQFVLRYESQRNAIVRFFRSIFSDNLATIDSIEFIREDVGPLAVTPEINMTDDGLWTIQLEDDDAEKLQPGTYTIQLTVAEGGKTFVDTFDFQWGMLAINPDQTEYTVGDTAGISLAALSSNGNTVCDANLALYIIDPDQYISHVPVYESGLCNGNNVINRPDYLTEFLVDTVGTYELYVEHIAPTGEVLSHTSDTFTVVPEQNIWIERNGPTRIYPPALYPMQITVHATDAFQGTLIERVPGNFIVHDTDARVRAVGTEWELSWDLNISASSSATFMYSFDAPDISPYLYTLGPAEVLSHEEDIVVSEVLPTVEEEMLTETIVTETDESSLASESTEVASEEVQREEEAEVVVEAVPKEESNADTNTETLTDTVVETEIGTHNETEITLPDPASETTEREGGEEEEKEVTDAPNILEKVVDFIFGDDEREGEQAPRDVTETTTPESKEEKTILEKVVDFVFGEDEPIETEVIATTTPEETVEDAPPPVGTKTFVESRKWQIASDATGSMLLYWASTTIPSGWTCVSCRVTDVFYQRFVLGSSTAGINGGASTHTHTATGVVTDSAASTNINQQGGGGTANVPTVGHDHTYTPTISTDSNLPAYRELVLIQYNSAGSPPVIPANAIAIFDAAVPSGWDAYTAQNGSYIRSLGTTTIGTTGGSNTHSHTISGNLLGTSNFLTAAAGDNLVNSASAAHTHAVNSFTDTVNHEPPYREAILGKLSATSTPTDAMIAMWTDTPPSGWGTVSSTSEPFVNRFVKPSATYGTTGGAATSTHANTTGITSDPPSATQTRDLAPNDNTVTTSGHTHTVDVTNYSTVTTLPPYRTAIFAKRAVGGAVPDAPTVHVLFDNELTGTSTPRIEFTGSDLDGTDSLIYQIQWDDDKDIGTSPLGDRTSSNEVGCSPNCFTNTASSSDTSPFVDGDRIRFEIQNALSSGTTYYFRVRVQESVGATWSSWSTVQSFTYESGINPSAWYQTEGTQFDGGTRANVSTTTGAVQLSTTTTSVPTVVSSWNVATASPGTTITLRKPANVEVGDLLLIIVGNDDGTDTDQWDNATLKPSGFTLINEAGNAATSDAHSAAFYRVADGTEGATTSVPAQASNDFWGYYIRVTGASTTNPINVTGADFNGAASPHAITSITTTASNTLAFYVLSGDGADTYPYSVSGTGWTESAETFAGAGGTESGGTWGTRSMVTAGATGAATVAMAVSDSASGFQFAINPSSVQGTMISPEIDFDSLSGQLAWGSLDWSVTEPTGTDVKIRVYYTSTTSCDSIVPETVLSGNSAGFDDDDAGFLITNLSTTTYNRICLKATLDRGTGASSPSLDDWTVFWAVPDQIPIAPTLADTPAFNYMKSTTTQPTFGGFASSDYESDRMEFELTIDDDPDFGSPHLTKQSSDYPVDAGWASSTFASGATTTYQVQAGDALTPGTTYWWRVRARDPLGTNTWSPYSPIRSVTISTAITVPEWFQTTDYQFGTSSTMTNATTTGTGGVEIVDLDSTISLLDAWSLGTTKAISSGSDRMLIVAIFNEDAQTDNINTVTYGGQTMTEIYDHTTGIGGSNSVWVGYLNDAGITAAVGTTIVPTWTPGSPAGGDVIYHSAVFSNVDQTTPVRGYASNALTTGTTIAPSASTTVYNGDMALYIAGVSNNRTFTPHTGYTEGTDNNTCASGCASATAYKAITSDGTELPTATLSSSGTRVIMTFVALKPVSAEGIITSSAVDFDLVSNQMDWGEVTWSLTEPAGSASLMQVLYASSSSSTCTTLIPNSALTGNSAGFSSAQAPINIASLSTTTYNRICLRMTLSEGSGNSTPTLEDWTVSWEPQPVFSQDAYHWFYNTAIATPTDTWPLGASAGDVNENEAIGATYPTKYDDVLRLRLGLGVSSVTASNQVFKLQYSEGSTCLAWSDVGDMSSTTALWRGYNNAGLADGQTLSSTTLDGSTVLESYEEENNSTTTPNSITAGSQAEWDWVIQNRANPGTAYCFRMVKSDGAPLSSYTEYPQLETNISPSIATIDTPFDNEKTASTSPWFEFTGVDPEADELDYQIQIDNDNDFSSAVIDTESETNLDDFSNIVLDSDKSPFNDSASIRYIIPSALTNGVTYWWRVRAKDTNGSTEFGEWSTARSFTIDTAVDISTWYQTTEEQFDTDTLVGTDASPSDHVAFASGSTTGTTTSSAIDFDDAVTGNAWGEFQFTETGAANNILYHIEYYDGDSWELIPDADLAGNGAGYDTSPVNLIDLDTETYNQIRLRANFQAGTPTLLDWTVTWGERVSVPTHLLLFDNEKTATTTPTFTFYSTDPEGDELEYEFSWSTDNTFATGSTTRNSTSSSGFLNTESGGDTNPFDSGDTISFTIPTSTPLTNGNTYWWRVRARDHFGSGSYSFWSDPWSFTVDTTATTSTWFQTTEEQFDTDTIFSLITTGSDSVTTPSASVTTYNFVGVTSPSTSHVARYFEVDVNDPTDPPTVDEIDTLTTNGTAAGTPNLNSAIAGYANNAEATNGNYTSLSVSDNNSWTTLDPGAGDNAVFWTRFNIAEDPADIDRIDILIEARQSGVPGADKGWFGIWRPGSTTPYWEHATSSTQTADATYTYSITTNIDDYFNGSNQIHLIYFNEDDSDPVIVDYVEVEITSDTADSGTLTGTSLDFNDGSGPAWGQMRWSDSEPGFSTLEYQLQYLTSGGSWALIPDGDLAGNSAGFSTSPINLGGLDTTTYNEIRPVANFDCVLSSCPTLNDWTITWSPGFTVAGTALEYDGTSSTTSGTVGVAVNGAIQSGKTGTIQADGTWSIPNVSLFEDDIITVFVNDGSATATDEAVAITQYDGTPDVSGMRLQKRHLTIGSDDYATISNDEIELFDFSDNENAFFDVDAGNDLTLCVDLGCSDASIRILPGNTYAPGTGGNVTMHDFTNYGTFTSGANTVRVSGSWDDNATTTLTGSTIIFTASTTSEYIDETNAITTGFNAVTFGEVGGTATWRASSTLDFNGNVNVTYGTFARGTTSLTLAGNLTTGANGYWTGMGTTTFDGTNPGTWTDQNGTLQNIGRVIVDGTAKTLLLGSTTTLQSLTIGADDTFDASVTGHAVLVYENWTNNNTFTARTGRVVFVATTTNRTITAGGDAFYNLTFNGVGGAWSFTEAELSITNDLTIATGTVTMPTGTTTLAGSFSSVGGTFAHNNALVYFTATAAKTIAASSTPFTNAFYNMRFSGSGSWTFRDASATTSNDILITQGTVTFPATTLTVGGSFAQTGGSFAHNSGTVKFTSASLETIDINSSSFNSLAFTGSGSWSFVDASVTVLDDLLTSGGTVTLPSTTLTLGGSLTNSATIAHNNGTVLFNSTDTGETINLGSSSLYNMTFNGSGGGWTLTNPATTTNNFTLTTLSLFTLSSGQTLAVGGTFTNSVGGASTTWTGSTLSLEAGSYSINTKTNTGDAYDTLRVKANTDIKMWNSSSSVYAVDSSGSLYSQDHSTVDGDLYIFGAYERTSGSEYWSYATDFDGTALGTTSARQVDVRFASGASASILGSLFEIQGTSTASTSIQNQGSGTYLVSARVSTTTFRYYDFEDLGLTGVSLAGSGVVTTLADGSFEPGTNGGTGLTVSSTTIDANPGLQIYRVEFATTSLISATNVTQIDAVPSSYWWFRESTGNIGGEAFDNDSGDPGSIRWDDSSLVITVSGTVYSDDGVTPMSNPVCDDSTALVTVVVQGGSTYTGECASSDGTFSIPGVTVIGSPVVAIYLNTNGGVHGSVITKTPTADITDLAIYQNRIITRHEDVDALTIEDMAVFDTAYDTDLRFDAASTTLPHTLTVFSGGELHIASSTTFEPGGDITIRGNASSTSHDGSLHIDDNATFIGSATSTYTLAGSFTLDTGATFTSASTSVIMNATTTGKTITTGSTQEITFNTLEFNGNGGGWNINGDIRAIQDIDVSTGTVSGTADITVVYGSLSGNGTLSMGSGTTTIQRTNTLGGTTPWTFGNLVLGSGSVAGTTTPGSNATTTILGKLTISTAHFLDAGGSYWNLAGTGNVFVENGTFQEDTSTLRYSGVGATNVISTTYYNLDLKALGGSPTYTGTGLGIVVSNNLTVGGPTATALTLDTNDPALDVRGAVTIDTTGTLVGSNSGSFTVSGNWDNNGTFTPSGGTVTFYGSGSPTIAAGNSSFANLTINGSGAYTIAEPATTTSAFTLTNAGTFTLANGQSLAVGGTFTNALGGGATTWTGSVLYLYGGSNYHINASTTSDTYETLRIGSGTQIRMWNSSASTYDTHSTASLYSQDHNAVNGDLYIYGAYTKTSGGDYWSYATDFDGTNIVSTPRNVDVYVRSGSSILYTGGSLAVVGGSSASTTIQNQGSGTYSIRIGGSASTTWTYYQLRNTDSAGLVFSGAPAVTSLSNGNYEVGQNSGTALTVGGTVITQNPAKTFTSVSFGTSTGIAPGYNVTATGTAASSWRFTNHTGSIDGEANDVDPNGDPGYVVWDDSAANIIVSGTVYSGEGSGVSTACDDVTSNIHIRVAGLTSYTGTCDSGDGSYSIGGVLYSPGDSLVVYIDGESEKAATVTEDPVSNITGVDLYENRVIVRHESADPLSIADMALWDASDDVDIPFTAVDDASDALTLPSDTKLIVWTNKTFEPEGDVTVSGGGSGAAYDGTLELYAGAVFDATGSETHTIGGSLLSGAGASIDDETSTFVFTTSGAGRTVDTNDDSFYNVTFNGSGSWIVTNSIFDINNDFAIPQGTVTLPSGTTTVTGSLNVTNGSFVAATSSVMVFDSAVVETIKPGTSRFGSLIINAAGSFTLLGTNATITRDLLIQDGSFTSATGTLAIGGDFIANDTFVHGSGILRFTATTSAVVTASSSDLYSTTFSGGGAYTFTDTNKALLGSLRIESGSVALATGTMSIGGSFVNSGGSFNNGSGTVLFNSSDTGETINPGGSVFHTVTLASAGGGWTISQDATTTGNFSLTAATNFTLSSSTRLYVGGIFTNLVGGGGTTWTGSTLHINSGSSYTMNSRVAGGDAYNYLVIGSSTALRAWDSTGTTTFMDSTSSFYSQDHAGVSGSLYIYGNYGRTTGTDYWSYATDFDGTALGGGSRQVFVSIANGATSTLAGGTLNIVGANGFDTTISNQGAGTYAMNITSGVFNAQYYSFSNMNDDGLNFQGNTTLISSLTEGNFTLAVNGGSLITVSSSTLNYNTGITITGVSFATTTAITGTNVAVVGSTPSAWTFTGHSGNIDGEAFDSDGIDDCGSVRWDDSTCLLTQQSSYRFRNDDGGEGVPDSEWYDTDWSKRKRVTLTNDDAVGYVSAVVKIEVPYDGDMQVDFDDLRFTDDTGLVLLSHFIESYTASTEAIVWVNVPLLATSTDTEIYMYYGNGIVTDASATTTFSILDNFEDGNISEYTGQPEHFTVGNTSAYERTYQLNASDVNNSKTTQVLRNTNVTISQGQKLRFLEYIDTTGTSDETCTHFGVQSGSQSYAVCLELFGVDRMSISENAVNRDTSGTVLASTTVSYTTGWYEVEVAWGTNNVIFATLSKDGSVVATTSATDSSYTSGGIGFTLWGFHGGWDLYSVRPLLANEPTTTLGFEQVSGGASWAGELNESASGIDIDENFRIRFLVENTGLPITDQNYEIEFAAKGNAPSCESVNFASYVEVPNVASCGVSDLCMVESSYITNQASTTDVLGGGGTFTYGQIIEDPSNNTGNVSIGANEFTEVEYALKATTNSSDSNYCLRVSNEGTDLDSYTNVAELSLQYAPDVPVLSLNGGADITLIEGATTTITATGTVTDLNGYADILGATTTMFRSGVGDTCTADNNNCYIAGNTSCSFSSCSGTSCEVSCSADFYYHADPTDAGTYGGETWRATLSVIDSAGLTASGTAPSIDLSTLRAISVDTGIDYGTLQVDADTGSYNATTTIQNIGNAAIDVLIEGSDLTNGESSVIPVYDQLYATSSFTYSACTVCAQASSTATQFELDLSKPASTTPQITDQLFWGLFVPFGVAGTAHQGVNILYATGD